jgi:hypothetical protein
MPGTHSSGPRVKGGRQWTHGRLDELGQVPTAPRFSQRHSILPLVVSMATGGGGAGLEGDGGGLLGGRPRFQRQVLFGLGFNMGYLFSRGYPLNILCGLG